MDLLEKIVKIGNKWQVQSEKGRNMGTYDTKEEAEKRLKQIEYFKYTDKLNEQLLLELNRNQLINKSKNSDNYKDTSKGRNRWERRNRSRIATTVQQYNKVNMDDFFKKDELTVGIEVHGETSDYIVTIKYYGALREILEQIKRNDNRLEFKCILGALQRTFNAGNVFVSCSCPDFTYRQAYWASKGNYNSGPIQPSNGKWIANPNDTKGAGCKHVNLVLGNIDWLMKVASVINNYIHYMEKYQQRLYADFIFPKIFGMPYQKAIQLNLFDTNDTLQSSERDLTLSNEYGRQRTRFRADELVNNAKPFTKNVKEPENASGQLKLDLDNREPSKQGEDEVPEEEKEKRV